jgi:hypothetical protein
MRWKSTDVCDDDGFAWRACNALSTLSTGPWQPLFQEANISFQQPLLTLFSGHQFRLRRPAARWGRFIAADKTYHRRTATTTRWAAVGRWRTAAYYVIA